MKKTVFGILLAQILGISGCGLVPSWVHDYIGPDTYDEVAATISEKPETGKDLARLMEAAAWNTLAFYGEAGFTFESSGAGGSFTKGVCFQTDGTEYLFLIHSGESGNSRTMKALRTGSETQENLRAEENQDGFWQVTERWTSQRQAQSCQVQELIAGMTGGGFDILEEMPECFAIRQERHETATTWIWNVPDWRRTRDCILHSDHASFVEAFPEDGLFSFTMDPVLTSWKSGTGSGRISGPVPDKASWISLFEQDSVQLSQP